MDAVRWNVPVDGNPKYAYECEDHPAVRATSYVEINGLCGTSGCSPEPPNWDWRVMGILVTRSGKVAVSPGDWIVTIPTVGIYRYSNEHFNDLFIKE